MFYVYLIFSLLCGVVSILGDHIGVGMLDYALFSMFIAISIVMARKRFVVPRSYMLILVAYILLMSVNAYLSPYTAGIKYVVIGAVATLMPFILFMVSYNYVMDDKGLSRLIDAMIYLVLAMCGIAVVETLLFPPVYEMSSILKISVIKPGFFASMCNQGVILSLYQYSISHKKKYRNLALILSVAAVLTIQLKVIAGLACIWLLYSLFMSKKKQRARSIAMMLSCTVVVVFAVSKIPSLSAKVEKYIGLYGEDNSYETVARPALYYQSVNIANDFFPLGSGQGTFGSIPVNMIYNPVYYDYGLNGIYGLGETGDNFKMDTHWSNILGENGYLGTLLYLLLFCYPLRYIRKVRNHPKYRSVRFLMTTLIVVVMFESLTLCIPGRMAFMFIYAGVLSIICRKISMSRL